MTTIASAEQASRRSPVRRWGVPVVLLVVAVVGMVLLGLPSGAGPPRLTVTAAAASPGAIGDMTAVYLVVENTGGADTVRSADSDAAAAVTLHDTEVADGAASMIDVDRLTVPARGELVLAPGGRHLMLHHLFAPLVPGDVVRVTVQFERSGPMVIDVPVQAYVDLAGFGSTGS